MKKEIKILMVDDDEEDFIIVRDIVGDIDRCKYTVEYSPSFEEGIKAIKEGKHDVCLIDYQLGAKTGLDLIEKAIKNGCEIPLILLTGQDNIAIDMTAMKVGASDYLVKGSISSQTLESSIRYSIAHAMHIKEMKALNSNLEKRVDDRTRMLRDAILDLTEAKDNAEREKQIAEDAVKSKQQFLANMSHEIRTPMNAIIGFSKIVLKTKLDQKQQEYIDAIKVSGDALIVLINDILDLAKVDSGKMTFEQTPFKLSTSISAMLHIFETKIQEKNLELVKEYDPAIPEVLLGDAVRLHQIILNLVSNSIKFTNEGKIIASIRMLKEDTESVTVEFKITDTGIGICESNLENIFKDFQQATSGTTRLFGGTGLGLAIVKQLVERQGGTITVKSKEGKGSTFAFVLNFKKTNEKIDSISHREETGVKLETGLKNIRVLVVEDMALNQLLMKTILVGFGFELDIAGNGKIAIEKLQTNTYDIILMDLQMPEMNGFEATVHIRNTMNSQTPIIALTADVTTVDVEKCKAAGMNDYIAKPVDEKLLYSKIIKYLPKPNQINTIPIAVA